MHNDGNLTSFTSQADIDRIMSAVHNPAYKNFWTGLVYVNSSDSWEFIDGADTNFAVSKILKIRIFQDEFCVVMSEGKLLTYRCKVALLYICQTRLHPFYTNPPIQTGKNMNKNNVTINVELEDWHLLYE